MKFDNHTKLGKRYSNQMVRILVILLSNEVLYEPTYLNIITNIAQVFYKFESLPFWDREQGMNLVKDLEQEKFLRCFKVNQQIITFALFEDGHEDEEEGGKENVRNMLLIMDFFYYASRKVRLNPINPKEFHIDVINEEWKEKLKDFYIEWFRCRRGQYTDDMEIDWDWEVKEVNKRTFHKILFLEFPWCLDAANKARLINYEGQIAKKKEMHQSLDFVNILMGGGMNPYLVVKVRRDSLIEDSLNMLVGKTDSLKKPLKVKFEGEPGVDEGGVQKEFFQLLTKQLFDENYGMFELNKESQLFWFRKGSYELPLKFELVGIILGLAIYNNHILDIHFPLALYKKLLDKPVTLDDFEQFDPQVGKSFRAILDHDKEDFEEVMCLNFATDYEVFGEKIIEDLIEGGRDIPVTVERRHEYVDLMIDYHMNKSISKFFNSFKKGFEAC